MHTLFLVITLLISFVSQAQYVPLGAITMPVDGYVITSENDTIRGSIRISKLVNDSPKTVEIQTEDNRKIKLKGDTLQLIAQRIPNFAYITGSIPRSREMVIFEQVPNPRQHNKPMLMERLTPLDGAIALYFDATGWKKSGEFTFGNFTLETNPKNLSYVVLKHKTEAFLLKRGEFNTAYEHLFSDCPAFVQIYPTSKRSDWRKLGTLITAYNQLCPSVAN